jgi:S-formylglutathione hydrolase FrmB
MGGFGAIRLAMHRPDVFSVIYAISPCCLAAVEDIGYGNVAAWNDLLQLKSYDDADAAAQRGGFYQVAVLGLLAALDPNPAVPPLYVNIPVVRQRSELRPLEPDYTHFRQQFPLQQVDQYRSNLAKLRALAIDYGFEDQFAHIPVATAAFSKALNDAHVAHMLTTYRSDHRQGVQERLARVVFPFISRNLDSD